MRQRFVDIYFDANGIPDNEYAGCVIKGTEGVIVLRVGIGLTDLTDIRMHVSIERPDGKIGSVYMRKQTDEEGKTSFVYCLTKWATAFKGELKLSFSLRYDNPLGHTEIINDKEVVVYPVDYMRLITLKVEESIEDSELIGVDPPSVVADILVAIDEVNEKVETIQSEQTTQNDDISFLKANAVVDLDMGLWKTQGGN